MSVISNTTVISNYACIAIALRRGWIFLTDDKAAREIAVASGVHVSGSVGCLILAVERQLLVADEANVLLQNMIQQGYRSPIADLEGLV